MKYSVPILLYHHVSPDREITPAALEAQLRCLIEWGYECLSLDEVYAVCSGSRALRRPAFAITFDDGYLDNWLFAFPILKKLNVKAAMYLVTDYVENRASPRAPNGTIDTRTAERGPGGFISWQEAKEMRYSGLISIGSHTLMHRHFRRAERYVHLESELVDSKRRIEEHLQAPCEHLAWPWGDFEKSWWPLVRKAGYKTAVTTLAGANTRGSNPLALRRLKVSRPDTAWLASRLRWNRHAWSASSVGFFYGWDRRLKTWAQRESPYAHG